MSVASFDPNTNAVTLTQEALVHFQQALLAHPDSKLVRLSTKESGCTGYAYVLDVVASAEADDVILHPSEDVEFAIAAEAIDLIRGTEIDMAVEGVNRVVKFNNPNVVAECGCGESFSV